MSGAKTPSIKQEKQERPEKENNSRSDQKSRIGEEGSRSIVRSLVPFSHQLFASTRIDTAIQSRTIQVQSDKHSLNNNETKNYRPR